MELKNRIERVDHAQKQHHKASVAVATVKKFVDDQSTNLASMIAYWAFFSIFPLFLALVTILGYVLPESIRTNVLEDVANLFPLLDPSTVGSLTGAWWPVILGLVLAFWSGSAVVRVTQNAFNSVWEIPQKDRPGLPEQLKKSMLALGTIGVGLVVATVISGFVTGFDLPWWGRIAGYAISFVLDVGIFVAAFHMLTDRDDLTWRDVLPGALLSGGAFFVLQQLSSLIVSRYLNNAQSTYGNFATVITILFWFYLQAQITLLGAQLNVVLKERLYPRSLAGGPETEADRRALEAYAQEATMHESEEVHARFDGGERRESEAHVGRQR